MAKVKLTFADIDTSVTVPTGTRIIEISEKVGAGVPYGCRESDCATCMIEVLDGAANLSHPSPIELATLATKNAGPQHRLACQTLVMGDATIKPAEL